MKRSTSLNIAENINEWPAILERGRLRLKPASKEKRKSVLNILIERHQGKCHWCNLEVLFNRKRNVTDAAIATIDHLKRKEEANRNEIINLVLAHKLCNNTRGHQLPWVPDALTIKRIKKMLQQFPQSVVKPRQSFEEEMTNPYDRRILEMSLNYEPCLKQKEWQIGTGR